MAWGGFLLTGFAWRLLTPTEAVFYGLDCILGVGDNRSGIGWIKRSGHLPSDSIYAAAVLMIAWKIATLVTEWD
jgi:hypothetical protein